MPRGSAVGTESEGDIERFVGLAVEYMRRIRPAPEARQAKLAFEA